MSYSIADFRSSVLKVQVKVKVLEGLQKNVANLLQLRCTNSLLNIALWHCGQNSQRQQQQQQQLAEPFGTECQELETFFALRLPPAHNIGRCWPMLMLAKRNGSNNSKAEMFCQNRNGIAAHSSSQLPCGGIFRWISDLLHRFLIKNRGRKGKRAHTQLNNVIYELAAGKYAYVTLTMVEYTKFCTKIKYCFSFASFKVCLIQQDRES